MKLVHIVGLCSCMQDVCYAFILCMEDVNEWDRKGKEGKGGSD
jgi:hypothetical protein